jgi:hypothetical protein
MTVIARGGAFAWRQADWRVGDLAMGGVVGCGCWAPVDAVGWDLWGLSFFDFLVRLCWESWEGFALDAVDLDCTRGVAAGRLPGSRRPDCWCAVGVLVGMA